jgi:very-short-patch-repair endonuclease
MRLTSDEPGARQAKRLRREMSLPEILLWRQLRHETIRWRKSHPAGPYALDFYCAPARLAIEVDGEAHERGDRPMRDAKRDAWIAEQGVLTLRIPAVEILRNLDGVLIHIRRFTERRLRQD